MDFMTKEFETLRDSTTLLAIADQVIQSPYPHFVVLNQRDELAGVLSLRDLRASLDKFEEQQRTTTASTN
jgi:CIC family chloride channel protein